MEANVCHENKEENLPNLSHKSDIFSPQIWVYISQFELHMKNLYEVAILRIVSELWDNIVITNYLFYLFIFFHGRNT